MSDETLLLTIKEDLSDKRRVFPCGTTPLGGCDFTRPDPDHVRDGKIFMRSTNLDHCGSWLTIDEYLELRKRPYRSVGIWSFVPENDPAAHHIAGAHSSPDYYGKRVYELEKKVEAIQGLIDVLQKAKVAINAMKTMADGGQKPRKLDEAMSWRENDAMTQSIVQDALAEIDVALAKVATS